MKLVILTDNNVLQSKNFHGEHGLCFYLETEDKKILFDTGYSDVFLKNACKMGINLLDLDYIVLSHGHYDHTWGLSHYLPFYISALKQGQPVKKPTIITHPDTFLSKFDGKLGEVGCLLSKTKLNKNFDIKLSKEPCWISDNLVFLGEIPRKNDFEGKDPFGKLCINNICEDDYLNEDSALAFISNEGLVIITGCSHSGICNITQYAKDMCNQSNIVNIIGGFHLFNSDDAVMQKTKNYLSNQKITHMYPCHCTNFKAKTALASLFDVKEAGVGLELQYTGGKNT